MSFHVYLDDTGYVKPRTRSGPRIASVMLHATAFFLLMHAPEIKLEPAKSEYKLAIEGKETKLVWYEFNKKLPAVTPPQVKAEKTPPRAATPAPQEIVASRKDAPKRTQMVWTPAPELPQPKPVDLPNILAIRLPEISRPFVAPPDIQKPQTAKIEVPAEAPQLQTKPLDVVRLADATKVTKRFVAPPKEVPVKIAEVLAPSDAPQLDARAATADLNYSFKTPARPFTAPPAKAAPSPAKTDVPDAPPELLSVNSRDLNLAVVGLNPTIKPAALPTNSSPGQFSAGPKIRLEGANSAGDGKGVNVPDLYVAGAKGAKPDLIAQAFAAPTSAMNLRAAARLANPSAPLPKDDSSDHSGAVRVSSAPDRRFDGRDVYMMAIQMPNLTSYSGSWLMWYAERTAHEVSSAPISPPVAHRKVDPKYIASAAADRIEGKVRLACAIGKDGRVSAVELVQGLDDRLNQAAEEAMAKWEFTPATRRGEPVEVEVLVEIPFRLAPHAQVPF